MRNNNSQTCEPGSLTKIRQKFEKVASSVEFCPMPSAQSTLPDVGLTDGLCNVESIQQFASQQSQSSVSLGSDGDVDVGSISLKRTNLAPIAEAEASAEPEAAIQRPTKPDRFS